MDFILVVSAICLIADLAMGGLLASSYYFRGLTVLRIRRAVPDGLIPPPSAPDLQNRFRSFLLPSMVFQDFGGYTYGFRYNFLAGSGLLHRVLVFEPCDSVLEVQGRLGWFMVLALLGIGVATLSSPEDAMALPFLAVGAGLYLIDAFSALWVASVAQRAWARSEEHPAA